MKLCRQLTGLVHIVSEAEPDRTICGAMIGRSWKVTSGPVQKFDLIFVECVKCKAATQ